MIGMLFRVLGRRVFNGNAVTLNCRELQLNDPWCARAARDDAGYTNGYFDAQKRLKITSPPGKVVRASDGWQVCKVRRKRC
jgi:hypothetical protein